MSQKFCAYPSLLECGLCGSCPPGPDGRKICKIREENYNIKYIRRKNREEQRKTTSIFYYSGGEGNYKWAICFFFFIFLMILLIIIITLYYPLPVEEG